MFRTAFSLTQSFLCVLFLLYSASHKGFSYKKKSQPFKVSGLLICSSRRPAAAVRPAHEARTAGRHRHAGSFPVERCCEFQITFKILLALTQMSLDHKEKGKSEFITHFCPARLSPKSYSVQNPETHTSINTKITVFML